MNRFPNKDYNTGSYRINKISLSPHNDKNTYLKMDIVSYKYHIFVYLFVNHIKNIAEYRQLVLMFALVRRAILFSFFSAL